MGVKSLNKYKNQYKQATEEAIKIADRLIQIESKLTLDMNQYL
jgi:hypothetical protein